MTFVLPAPAGGPLDVMVRFTLPRLQGKWGVPVVTEMAPHLVKVPHDPVGDFEMIAFFADTEQLFVVSPSAGGKTLAQLVAKAKASPGKLS